jgi:hypothetical protein
MTTRKSKKTKPPAPPAEVTIEVGDIVKAAERSFSDADTNRVRTLEDFAALRTARSHILTRKRDELAATAGRDAPAVKALDASIDDVTESIKAFKAQAELAAKPQAAVPKPDETIVRGVIRGADAGVSGVKVSLADENGAIKGTSATTDDTGHFELRLAFGEKVRKKLALHVHDDRHPEPVELEPEPGSTRFVAIRLED